MGLTSSRFVGGASLPRTWSDAAATRALKLTSLAPSEPRAIALPSEIIELVLLSLSRDPQILRTDDEGGWKERHAGLRAASLVSKQWGAVAQRLLYGRLELKWEAVSAANLLRTFEENPHLLQLVRSIVTLFTNSDHWDEEWYESSERDDALAEADLLFPNQGLDDWGEGAYGDDHESYVVNRGYHASIQEGIAHWLRAECPGRQEGSDCFWRFVAKLPNLRSLSMRSMDMPIRDSLLRKLESVLARLTIVGLEADNDNALSIFPLLHSVEVVSVYASHRDRGVPSHQSPPREQRTGQLKYMRADVADLAVLGLNFTTLVGLELQNIGEVDLFDFTHNLFPTLVNLELLAIRGVTWNDPFSDDTLQYFCKSLSHTKLTQLYLPHAPTSRQLGHLPPTIETLGLDCRLCPYEDTAVALERVPHWKGEYLPNLKDLIIAPPYVRYDAREQQEWDRECKVLARTVTTFKLRYTARHMMFEVPGPWAEL